MEILLIKADEDEGYWHQLLKDKNQYKGRVKIDWDLWRDEDEEKALPDDFGGMGGMGGMGGGGMPGMVSRAHNRSLSELVERVGWLLWSGRTAVFALLCVLIPSRSRLLLTTGRRRHGWYGHGQHDGKYGPSTQHCATQTAHRHSNTLPSNDGLMAIHSRMLPGLSLTSSLTRSTLCFCVQGGGAGGFGGMGDDEEGDSDDEEIPGLEDKETGGEEGTKAENGGSTGKEEADEEALKA